MIVVVADDLTGAADAGLGFRQAGFSTTVVRADTLAVLAAWMPAEVLAINAGTRSASLADAVERTSRLVASIRTAGASTLYKKVDSTLRGHIAGELAATLAAWHPDAVAIVAPAFPRLGRTMTGGVLFVHGRAASGAPLLPLLHASGIAAAIADVDLIRAGGLQARLLQSRGRGRPHRAVICDVETDDDLAAIAAAGVEVGARVVWVASGGLAPALAVRLQGPDRRDRPGFLPASGPILAVVGSWSPVAVEQVRELRSAGAMLTVVPVESLNESDPAAADRCAAEVMEQLKRGADVVVTLSRASSAPEHGGDPRLVNRLGARLAPAADLVGGLILAGGDTAAGLLHAWGIDAFRLVGEVDAGIPLSTVRHLAREIPIVTKAGAFGPADALTRARDRLRGLKRQP